MNKIAASAAQFAN